MPSEVIMHASGDAYSFRMTVPETVYSPVVAISSDSPGSLFVLPEPDQTNPSISELDFFLDLDPSRAHDSSISARPAVEPPLYVPTLTDTAKEFLPNSSVPVSITFTFILYKTFFKSFLHYTSIQSCNYSKSYGLQLIYHN